MKKLFLSLLCLGLASPFYAQEVSTEVIKEITISAVNYKYLNAVDNQAAPIPVKLLERKAASFDLTTQDFYYDDYDYFEVTLHIPQGRILAAYDKEGTLLRTIERYKDVKLPDEVAVSILKNYPGWKMIGDVYSVRYHDGKSKRIWKVSLTKGNKIMRIKMDPYGNELYQ